MVIFIFFRLIEEQIHRFQSMIITFEKSFIILTKLIENISIEKLSTRGFTPLTPLTLVTTLLTLTGMKCEFSPLTSLASHKISRLNAIFRKILQIPSIEMF